MKVGDLVRSRICGVYGVVIEGLEPSHCGYDGLYLVVFTDGDEDYCDDEDVEVVNESR